MKKYHSAFLFIAALFVMLMTPIKTFADDTLPYNHVVFLGDSLTDNGNLYKTTLGIMPKSPPYYQGRFTNGLTWADDITAYYDKKNITAENYAVGGETAILHNPLDGFLPYMLSESVSNYLLRSIFRDKSHTLFVIWIGANDYLNGAKNVDESTTPVVDAIRQNIENLIANGGKYFLILNLPDLAKTPYAKTSPNADNLTALALSHNVKLDTLISEMQMQHPEINIHLFDIYALFNDLISNPAKYNEKYHLHLTNTNETCWPGGYTLQQMQMRQETLAAQLEKELTLKSMEQKIEAKQLANYIANSPALSAAYQVGESATRGAVACTNPDDYIFWDRVHPTVVVHSLFAEIMMDYIKLDFGISSNNKNAPMNN